MLTGSRPGGNIGFGMVTFRMVDLLHRIRPWALVISLISLLGAVALLALAGLMRPSSGGVSPGLVLGFAGILALIVLLLAVPLYRFARAVKQIAPSNQGPNVASAFEHLGSFWRRAGIIGALFVGGCLFMGWRAWSDPRLAGFVASVFDPRVAVQREQERRWRQEGNREYLELMQGPSPLFLKPARFGWSPPRRVPPPQLPRAPGRILTFDQIGEACPVAAESFLCLLNHPGEELGEGNRQVLTGADARFSMLSKSDYEQEYLQVVVERAGRIVRLGLGPPKGFPLMKMMYPRATNTGWGGVPLISFSKSTGPSCDGNGKFRIVDLAWGADGLPDRLVVDFEQECGYQPPVIGRLSIQPGTV